MTDSWPPDYNNLFRWRAEQVKRMAREPAYAGRAFEFYRTRPANFITRWVDTYDPRNASVEGKLVRPPLFLFDKQIELIQFLTWCINNQNNGLIEKARDMGATWVCCGFSVHTWLFSDGASIGWGSRKEMLVDRMGDMDSIFEKMRSIIRGLPPFFLPRGFSWNTHSNYMRLINPENGASITGEAGDNIGRGGRKLIYFKDESAHYEHPESIEAALADNTRVQIDISSVNGLGNVFHRRREAGREWHPGQRPKEGRTSVFVMDWRDHPEKDETWYARRKAKALEEGLMHLFAQEVDRNYSAAVEGVVIPAEWVSASLDAHKKLAHLGNWDEGRWFGALDVADGGGDLNAFTRRKGVVLKYAEQWGSRDTTVAATKAVELSQGLGLIDVGYDCIGVGAGVKGEINRLTDLAKKDPATRKMMARVKFTEWNAGLPPMFPDEHLIKNDKNSPLNKDFFLNMKAQGWWELRRRFEKTFKAVTEGVAFDIDELISLDTASLGAAMVAIARKELSQPTMDYTTGRSKLIIDKAPEGVRSPNVGDSIMMNYFPVKKTLYDTSMGWVDEAA